MKASQQRKLQPPSQKNQGLFMTQLQFSLHLKMTSNSLLHQQQNTKIQSQSQSQNQASQVKETRNQPQWILAFFCKAQSLHSVAHLGSTKAPLPPQGFLRKASPRSTL